MKSVGANADSLIFWSGRWDSNPRRPAWEIRRRLKIQDLCVNCVDAWLCNSLILRCPLFMHQQNACPVCDSRVRNDWTRRLQILCLEKATWGVRFAKRCIKIRSIASRTSDALSSVFAPSKYVAISLSRSFRTVAGILRSS